jgi:hypothetical protein
VDGRGETEGVSKFRGHCSELSLCMHAGDGGTGGTWPSKVPHPLAMYHMSDWTEESGPHLRDKGHWSGGARGRRARFWWVWAAIASVFISGVGLCLACNPSL